MRDRRSERVQLALRKRRQRAALDDPLTVCGIGARSKRLIERVRAIAPC
jgi:hypothetical protein